VGTLLRRLKPHLALFTESDSSVQTAVGRAIAPVTSASRHPYLRSAIEVPIWEPVPFG